MKNRSPHNSNSIEPLPDHFEPDLTRIDARLMQESERMTVPPGLAGRVFQASVGRLPSMHLRLVPTETQVAAGRRLSWRRQTWGRVALAASVGLAGAVALRMLQAPAVIGPEPVALLPAPELDFVDPMALSMDSEQLLLGFMSDQPSDLSYLTFGRVTLDDLNSEMVNMLAELNEQGM
jgi:hypothetical protein